MRYMTAESEAFMKIKKTGDSFFSNPIVITLAALFCCLLWGSATPFIKIGYKLVFTEQDTQSTILFAGMRFFFAGILTVIIFSIGRRKLLYPKPENLGRVGLVSVFQTILQYIFFYVGLTLTTGVKGTIASGTSAFFSVIVASLIFRQEKLIPKKIIACLLGFAGIILININGLEFTMNWGDIFVIFSAISLAFSSVLIKKFSKFEDPVVISGYQFIIGGAFLVVLGLLLGGKMSFASTKGTILLVYLAFLSAIAYALWGILLKYNPVSKVTVFSFTTPIFGTILSLIFLPESANVDPIFLVFTLLLVSGGIFLLNYQKQNKQ